MTSSSGSDESEESDLQLTAEENKQQGGTARHLGVDQSYDSRDAAAGAAWILQPRLSVSWKPIGP
jgi:hypothetical protein